MDYRTFQSNERHAHPSKTEMDGAASFVAAHVCGPASVRRNEDFWEANRITAENQENSSWVYTI